MKASYSNEKRTYRVTIHDGFNAVNLTGEFIAEDEQTAIEKAQGSYSCELDCNPEDVVIVCVEEA